MIIYKGVLVHKYFISLFITVFTFFSVSCVHENEHYNEHINEHYNENYHENYNEHYKHKNDEGKWHNH